MLRPIIYPFALSAAAASMLWRAGRKKIRASVSGAINHLVEDSISDARDINELRAEIAVLRSDLNDLKYGGIANASPRSSALSQAPKH